MYQILQKLSNETRVKNLHYNLQHDIMVKEGGFSAIFHERMQYMQHIQPLNVTIVYFLKIFLSYAIENLYSNSAELFTKVINTKTKYGLILKNNKQTKFRLLYVKVATTVIILFNHLVNSISCGNLRHHLLICRICVSQIPTHSYLPFIVCYASFPKVDVR